MYVSRIYFPAESVDVKRKFRTVPNLGIKRQREINFAFFSKRDVIVKRM